MHTVVIYKNVYSAFGFQRLSLDVIFVIVVVLGFTHTHDRKLLNSGYSHIFLYIAVQTPLTIVVVLHYNLVNNIAAAVVKYSMFIEQELYSHGVKYFGRIFKKSTCHSSQFQDLHMGIFIREKMKY